MKIIILGGKGYLGWPMSMKLSSIGHKVTIIDNGMKDKIAKSLNVKPLFPNSFTSKLKIFNKHKDNKINVLQYDCCNYKKISKTFEVIKPDAIIHFAEQASAPYSMIDFMSSHLTLNNNITSTFNVLHAMKEYCPNSHLIKLGTMGEYGTPNIDIEEGWLTINHKNRKDKFIYPRAATSLYHTSKILDTDLIWFYVRNYNLRVTDLMQGPVYGFETKDMQKNDKLFTSLYFDSIFGTVINRFLVQASVGEPLTIYGKGEQTRGYLDINDTLQCIELALSNRVEKGELRILNQFTETLSVNQIAEKIQKAGNLLKMNIKVKHIRNPRKEKESHYYRIKNTGLRKMGLKPHLLSQKNIIRMLELIKSHIQKKDIKIYNSYVKWT